MSTGFPAQSARREASVHGLVAVGADTGKRVQGGCGRRERGERGMEIRVIRQGRTFIRSYHMAGMFI